ncbi:MAG: hypothetical protein ACOX62_06255 [Christensenellales bacterium]|jgi:hypothetical protein
MNEGINDELYNAQLKLAKKLSRIRNDDNFVNGIMWQLDHIDDVEAMIDFIENKPEEATPSNITLFAVNMSNDRDGNAEE